jgi:DNA adenine methylase
MWGYRKRRRQFRNGFAPSNFVTKLPVSLPLKTFGGKGANGGKPARWIVSLMPPHKVYVEPFAGGLAVLLNKNPEGVSEIINDLSGHVTNFWYVVRDDGERLQRYLRTTDFSPNQWRDAAQRLNDPDPMIRAASYFNLNRQSLSGRMDTFTPLSDRTRRGMNEHVSSWLSAIDGLSFIQERLQRVVNVGPQDGLEVIRQYDGPDVLFYIDSPYLPETRTAPDVYECEMSEEQHRALLTEVNSVQAKVLLSGYRSQLYDEMLPEPFWKRHELPIANHAAGGKKKRRMTECVWANF